MDRLTLSFRPSIYFSFHVSPWNKIQENSSTLFCFALLAFCFFEQKLIVKKISAWTTAYSRKIFAAFFIPLPSK